MQFYFLFSTANNEVWLFKCLDKSSSQLFFEPCTSLCMRRQEMHQCTWHYTYIHPLTLVLTQSLTITVALPDSRLMSSFFFLESCKLRFQDFSFENNKNHRLQIKERSPGRNCRGRHLRLVFLSSV